jgi:hypothetical protein
MNVKKLTIGLVCLLIMSIQPTFATVITAETTHISGNTWESNYTITNDTLVVDLEWFTIYFPSGLYTNLLDLSTLDISSDWDIWVNQPDDPFVGADGWFDALAWPGFGLASGASLTNFIIRFDYLGTGTQIVQDFEVYDAADVNEPFALPIDSGQFETSAVAASAPDSLLLTLFSLMVFGALRKSRSSKL